MMRSLYSGVSGLKTHQTRMDVIGNNIANVNTVAYKSSSMTFSELMYQTTQSATGANAATGRAGINAKQIGLGVVGGAISANITTAGATQTTGNPFDIRITGDSFFVVSSGTENYFTRAGAFYVDGQGNLAMTTNGYTVMGWEEDPTAPGTIRKDTVTALKIMSAENMTSSPEATTQAYITGIIDKNSDGLISDKGQAINMVFYDNLGYSYTAKYAVTKYMMTERATEADMTTQMVRADGTPLYYNNVDDMNAAKAAGSNAGLKLVDNETGYPACYFPGEEFMVATPPGSTTYAPNTEKNRKGELPEGTYRLELTDILNSEGVSLKEVYGTTDLTSVVTIDGGTDNEIFLQYSTKGGEFQGYYQDYDYATQSGGALIPTDQMTDNKFNMTFKTAAHDNFSEEGIEVSMKTSTMYDNKGTSTVTAVYGDYDGNYAGRKLGEMSGVAIETNGKIWASYDNGTKKLLGQIAVATFANPSGLEKQGENLYSETQNSGAFDGIGVEVDADGGSMSTGVLEMSNVDLSSEFTEMITTQRGFQANSRIITVSDTLIEELVNLKR
ncbi:MAG TPA: flagellar hook-basal body complex protein [Lachnospiraceae bacterium]|nr:flagellar hook-basal body complex protein [Lachnospiraceae bacterium]